MTPEGNKLDYGCLCSARQELVEERSSLLSQRLLTMSHHEDAYPIINYPNSRNSTIQRITQANEYMATCFKQ